MENTVFYYIQSTSGGRKSIYYENTAEIIFKEGDTVTVGISNGYPHGNAYMKYSVTYNL